MRIYLIQHGKPVPEEENPARPLSERGRDDVEHMAWFLKKCGVTFQDVFHSGR